MAWAAVNWLKSAPLTRGIFATSFVTLSADVKKEQIAEAFAGAFAGEPFVREVEPVGYERAEVGFDDPLVL